MYILDDLAKMINESMPGETQYAFATYVYRHLGLVGRISITELAKRCSLSAPTISRIIARMGYGSYKEFREVCGDMAYRLEHPPDHGDHFYLGPDNVQMVFEDVLVPSLQQITDEQLDLFLSYLGPHHTTALLGMINMRSVAESIQQNIHTYRDYNVYVPRQTRFIDGLRPSDAVILLSVRGNMLMDAPELEDCLHRCRARKLLVTTSDYRRGTDEFDDVVSLKTNATQYLVNNYLVHLFVDMALCRAGLYD